MKNHSIGEDLAQQVHIKLHPSGRQFSAAQGQTILEAAIAAGVGIPYGCKRGICGSCTCKVLSGKVIYRDAETDIASSVAEGEDVKSCCCLAKTDVVIEFAELGADMLPVQRLPGRVLSLARSSPDVMVLKLQVPAKDPLRYRAGQYFDLVLGDGTRRSYSSASALEVSSHLELHVRWMPGGKFTDHVFTQMCEKQILRLEGPFGEFHLREDSNKPIVLLASGTGFAPLKAILEYMNFKKIDREIALYWGGRRPQDLYMDSWVREICTSMPGLTYVPVISDALPSDNWGGRSGFVHKAVTEDFPDLSGHQVYACGAPIVVNSAREEYTQACGLPLQEFYADTFVTAADRTKVK
jgi:CDP-4-dehydro-6-deoxyglucose reductase